MSPAYLLAAQRIRRELGEIERVVEKALQALDNAVRDAANETFYYDSVALNLHGFYSGVERIMELVAAEIDEARPGGRHWHQQLLEQMALEVPSVRPAVISEQTCECLTEYLAFRHIVRKLYTFNFRPERLKELTERLPATFSSFRQDADQFLAYLDAMSRADET